jgi:uncharacterized membrane protein (UPF0182 family)
MNLTPQALSFFGDVHYGSRVIRILNASRVVTTVSLLICSAVVLGSLPYVLAASIMAFYTRGFYFKNNPYLTVWTCMVNIGLAICIFRELFIGGWIWYSFHHATTKLNDMGKSFIVPGLKIFFWFF